MKHTNSLRIAVLSAAASTPLCVAQFERGIGGWEIRVSNTVSPAQPSATIEVWAWMDYQGGPIMAFIRGDFDLTASDSAFSGPEWLRWEPILGSGSTLGIVSGSRVDGVYGHFQDAFPHSPFSLENPFPCWKVTWTTSDFTPRRVSLDADSERWFTVAYQGGWLALNLFPSVPERYFPGHTEIRVVPAPGVLALGLGLLASRRRRAFTGTRSRGA